MSETLLLLPILLFGFIGIWIFVCFLLAQLSGWSRLAVYYRTPTDFSGRKWEFQTGRLRWARYRGCLTIGTNSEYLYLAVFPLFRVGHPPLLIPWSDITTSEHKGGLFSYRDFAFTKAPAIKLRVLQGLGNQITSTQSGLTTATGEG